MDLPVLRTNIQKHFAQRAVLFQDPQAVCVAGKTETVDTQSVYKIGP